MESFMDSEALKETWPTIPLVLSGEDLQKQSFTDSSNVVMAKGGSVLWDTTRELEKQSYLNILHEASGRKTVGKVQWASPQGEGKFQVWVDVDNADSFWKDVVTHEIKAKTSAKAQVRMAVQSPATTPVPVAQQPIEVSSPVPSVANASASSVQQSVPVQSVPLTSRFTDALNDMVRSSLDSSLSSAVTRITSDIQADLAKMQATVQSNLQQSIQTAVNTFSSRISAEAGEIVTRTGSALDTKLNSVTQRVNASTQEAETRIQATLEETIAKSNERIQAESNAIVSEALRAESEIKEHLEQHAKQIREHSSVELSQPAEQSVQNVSKQIEVISQEAENHARETFVQNMMMELIREHEAWFSEARRILHEDADENVRRMRQELGRFVKNLGESMVEQNIEHNERVLERKF